MFLYGFGGEKVFEGDMLRATVTTLTQETLPKASFCRRTPKPSIAVLFLLVPEAEVDTKLNHT